MKKQLWTYGLSFLSPPRRLCFCQSLFVCLCVSKVTQKVMERSFWNFQGMSGMAKTTSDSIFGVIRKESWILDHFIIFFWWRSALSDCFSSLVMVLMFLILASTDCWVPSELSSCLSHALLVLSHLDWLRNKSLTSRFFCLTTLKFCDFVLHHSPVDRSPNVK